MALFEVEHEGTKKFYRVTLEGTSVRLVWGRIGTKGQEKVTDYRTVDEATRQYNNELDRRSERGYTQIFDETLPRDADAARAQETAARLAVAAPLTTTPRFLFKHEKQKKLVWLEQREETLTMGTGRLGAKEPTVPTTEKLASAAAAQRELNARTAKLLAEGYTLDAFGSAPAPPSAPAAKAKREKAPKEAITVAPTKPWPPRSGDPKKPFAGYGFAFFGEFGVWPSYHPGTPAMVAEQRGADIHPKLDAGVDCAVFGDRRGSGRSEAKKQAERLRKTGGLHVLDEAAFRELVRVDLTGKSFLFVGGFDCSPGGVEEGVLAKMAERVGGVAASEVSPSLDYLVSGNRQGAGKVATQNKVAKLNAAGASIQRLTETGFLELVRTDAPASESEADLDFAGFLSGLYGRVNEGKLGRALAMLRSDRHQLFSSLDEKHLVGVVKSQSGSGSVYASWLAPDGRYGCMSSDLSPCMGLQGSPCKHLLVLVVGLARAGELPTTTALAWMRNTARKLPNGGNDQLCAETFIRYKGAEAGEVDWRPTETMPEDFYAL